MKVFFKKLILGKPIIGETQVSGALEKHLKNIKSIWNNENHDDIGIEKLLRLLLAVSQLVFMGTYLKHIFRKKGIAHQDVAIDFLVLVKVILPVMMLYTQTQHNPILFFINMWFVLETLLYVPTLIFASDIFSRPRSYGRSMLLLFLNYIEIVCSFSVLYARGNYLNKPFVSWFDSIYFSFTTSASIGFGDYFPTSGFGKFLVSAQSIIFLIFVVLFLNFFSSKVENKGYFDTTK